MNEFPATSTKGMATPSMSGGMRVNWAGDDDDDDDALDRHGGDRDHDGARSRYGDEFGCVDDRILPPSWPTIPIASPRIPARQCQVLFLDLF
mmetsp:Transcript_16795/g.39606  ORF Transcript_16795/g.39606 Transcript_16795/m.39606 type:complete len:92 (+) Transcript_16795:73-348(+)